MIAPWKQFPKLRPSSPAWREGETETYMKAWRDFFENLEKDERKEYMKSNRAPFYWFFFYWGSKVPDSWTFPYFFLLLMSWPLRAIHHLVYKMMKS